MYQHDLRLAAIQLRRTTASPTTNLAQSSIYKTSVNAGQQLSKNINQLLSKIYLGEYTSLSPDIVIVLQYFIKCCRKLLLCETTSMNGLIEESIGIFDIYYHVIGNTNETKHTLEFVMQTCGGMSCEIDPTYAPNGRITEVGVEAWLIDRADRMQDFGKDTELKMMFH